MSSRLVPLWLILVLCLVFASVSPASATSNDEVKWSRVNIPTEGKTGNWALASVSDIRHLAMAIDGTLYAYGQGLSYTLLKSTDNGTSWSATGQVKDDIVDIATAPDDANVIYYATSSCIYKSADAGSSFALLPPNPGGAGSNNVEITSIDVTYAGRYITAAGTRDTDNGEHGGVYILDQSLSFTWTDTNVGNYDVYAVAFSPNFPVNCQLVAVVTDETDSLVTTRVGDAGWGATIGDARLDKDNSGIPTPVAVSVSADIAFPDEYNTGVVGSACSRFAAIDTGSGNGDVYRINGTGATDLNISSAHGLSNIDVTSIAVTGNTAMANLLAGTAGSAQVYFSTDGGRNWTRSDKEPTGQTNTYVVMAPDFISSRRAFATTSGVESAFSYTIDGGGTWHQLSLIDTQISNILDLALSPNYEQDSTCFMVTWGGEHSLWRSHDGGAQWERVGCSTLTNMGSIRRVGLSPQYGNGSQAVFIAGSSDGNPAIWHSTDGGQSFSEPWVTHDPTTSATFPIDVWAVADDNTLLVGSYNGSNGLVYRSNNGGWTYSTAAVAGSQSLYFMALSPAYNQDKTILVGNTNGWVYWSNDNGATFEPLLGEATSPPFTGSASVAFDPNFSNNHTAYAASDKENEGIHRFVIGSSTEWVSIDSTLPNNSKIGQLVVSADGTLYASNFKGDGGLERCLNPTYSLGPNFETVTRGLADGAALTGLWLNGHRLWSIDTTNTRLMTFNDSLTSPISLTSPSDGTSGIGTIINHEINDVTLDWEVLPGATHYRWQLNYDNDFSSLPPEFEDDSGATSARLPPLKPATEYYWRVRATEPVLSPWSPKWSFTTCLGADAIAPELISPNAGASDSKIKPIFQWSAVAGAQKYELLVATDALFTAPVIAKVGDYALPATAWQCDINLDHDTTYYWKVRAIGSGTYSAWSAVSAFGTDPLQVQANTSPAPEPLPTVPQSSPSPPPSQSNTPEWPIWLMYLGAALLFTTIATLITLIILTVRVWRL